MGWSSMLHPIVEKMAIIDRLRQIGWLVVEAAFLLVVLCVLLNVILGDDGSGQFITDVAGNAMHFLQTIPPGIVIGFVLIVVLYRFIELRRPK
jgi:NhaP-type Na+/H+ or K+/H+ antiporter